LKLKIALIAIFMVSLHQQANANADLVRVKNCYTCHAVDRNMVGPSYRVIAAKYAKMNQAQVTQKLAEKIMRGGSGSFGPQAMPGNPNITPPEATALAQWVLSMK